MITYVKKAGTADVSVVVRIVDSTDGTPETGVVPSTSGLALKYRRDAGTIVTFSAATLVTLADAHADGGILHIDSGYYRLDLPDAAVAASSTGVLVSPSATGMIGIGSYVQLVAYDPTDTVRLGLTALPNAAADAAGGLPISDAGGLDLDAKIGALTFTVANKVDVNATHFGGTAGTFAAGRPEVNATHFAGTAYATALAAEVDAIHDEVVEGTTTFRQSMRLANAALSGKASGLGTTTAVYRDLADTLDRISATVDADGNRTAVTRTLT